MDERVYLEKDMPPVFGKERGLRPVPIRHGTGFLFKRI
jgi:hypothetical protein